MWWEKDPYSVGFLVQRLRLDLSREPTEYVSSFHHLRTKSDTVSETYCLLIYGIPNYGQVQNASKSECYAASSEPFKFYLLFLRQHEKKFQLWCSQWQNRSHYSEPLQRTPSHSSTAHCTRLQENNTQSSRSSILGFKMLRSKINCSYFKTLSGGAQHEINTKYNLPIYNETRNIIRHLNLYFKRTIYSPFHEEISGLSRVSRVPI
jgi:hypothetical protein